MPKIVDPGARRLAVTDAVFRVIRRDGLEGATLRAIADEAGLAIGSVRHYFTGHTELTLFALDEFTDRVTARILAHVERLNDPARGTAPVRRRDVEDLLGEFLPLDDARRDEIVVWLAFVTAARTRPELHPRALTLYEGMRTIVGRVLARADAAGRLVGGLDPALETERLCAVLDGLAVNAVLHPDRLPPDTQRAVLGRHLDTLLAG
ncbi:TetR/AcrR family transcriptional regulator [Longispora urticae]